MMDRNLQDVVHAYLASACVACEEDIAALTYQFNNVFLQPEHLFRSAQCLCQRLARHKPGQCCMDASAL